jgi:hypothetical protein
LQGKETEKGQPEKFWISIRKFLKPAAETSFPNAEKKFSSPYKF